MVSIMLFDAILVNTAYSNLRCQMSNNCETLVKPRSRYSRETSGNFFSSNWKCTRDNVRETPDMYEPRSRPTGPSRQDV